jgi:hypothetical protein
MNCSVSGPIIVVGMLVFLSLPPFLSAQTQPDLELTRPRQWRVEFNPHRTAARSGRFDTDYPDEPRPSKNELMRVTNPTMISEAEVAAFNKGSKAIKAITWEHAHFSDAGMSRVLTTYRFRGKAKIRPGETKLVRAKGYVSPWRSHYQKVRPLRIEYADGSVWQSP